MSYKSDLIDIEVEIVHSTDLAWLVDHGGKKPTWIPKSLCEVEKHDKGATLTLSEKLALEKGLI